MKKKCLLPIFIGLCLCSVLIFVINIDRWLAISDEPAKADLIVCLGGGLGDRVKEAAYLYHQGLAKFILLTGPEWNEEEFEKLSLSVKMKYLELKGVPTEAIIREHESRSTYDEAINTKKIMEEKGLHSVIIVSDPYHMRRVRYSFMKVFKGSGIKLFFVPSKPKWAKNRWWQTEEGVVNAFSELLKLIYYWITKR